MLRKTVHQLHFWLGIVSGAVVFIVCLTGAMLVFREEIIMLAQPEKYYVRVPQNRDALPVDALIKKAESEHAGMRVEMLTVPEQKNRTVTLLLIKPQPKGRVMPAAYTRWLGTKIFMNPYTGETVNNPGEPPSAAEMFVIITRELHRNLLINIPVPGMGTRSSAGGLIVAAATIIFAVECLTGLVLWLPRSWNSMKRWSSWKQGLTVKFRAGWGRCLYDLHNTLGFYLLIPVLILALTGLCWSFSWYRAAVSTLCGDTVFKNVFQKPEKIIPPPEGVPPLSIAQILGKQRQLTPDCELFVTIPRDRETALTIQTRRTGFFALSVQDKTEWNRFTGEAVMTERFADKSFGAKTAASVSALHYGNITGLSSKILFFFVSLFAATLPVTGVMWRVRKWKKKQRPPVPPITVLTKTSINIQVGRAPATVAGSGNTSNP
ncbi:MAG: PepSY domain-containing protein [Planctomycetaceae bacterium]|jgi:uncharacterized iron-regulated membrane protein|nr:PepSY domain-containing protein [Planctomycetaceae bacterium]